MKYGRCIKEIKELRSEAFDVRINCFTFFICAVIYLSHEKKWSYKKKV